MLASEWWVDRVNRFSIDDEGFFLTWVLIITCCFGMLKEGVKNEYDKQGRRSVRKKRKCGREWRWRTSGKVNWEGYREKG